MESYQTSKVRLKSKNSDKFVTSHVFLDSCSTVTILKMKIAKEIYLEGRKTALNLTTMGQHRTESCCILHSLKVSDSDESIKLPFFYTQLNLIVSRKDIVTLGDLENWSHLIVWC